MRISSIIYLFVILCFVGWRCSNIRAQASSIVSDNGSNDSLSNEEYQKWYTDNVTNLSVIRKMKDVTYTLEYLPPGLMQLNHNISENAYDKFLVFTLKVELEDKSDILKYPSVQFTNLDQRVHYLSFDMQRFVTLNGDHKRVACTIFNYEKNYGLKPFTEFTVGFDKASVVMSENFTVQLNDQYFGSGEINFSIDNSIINKAPKLKN